MEPALLVAALAFGLTGPPAIRLQTPLPAPMRVFVRTDDGGEETELAARRQSVEDLVEALEDKKKHIRLVKDRAQAEIVIEVLDRGVTVPRVVFGIGGRPGQPPGGTSPARYAVLRVELTFGDEALELKNKNKAFDHPGGWKSAAEDIAKQVEKWIAERRKLAEAP